MARIRALFIALAGRARARARRDASARVPADDGAEAGRDPGPRFSFSRPIRTGGTVLLPDPSSLRPHHVAAGSTYYSSMQQ